MEECMNEKKGCTVVNHYYECCGGSSNVAPVGENDYSTEETVCGKWIDGKPIYRKVITGTLAKDSGNGIIFGNISDLKVDQLIKLYGNMPFKDNSYQIAFPISYNEPKGVSAAINMYYDVHTGNICYYFLNHSGFYSGCTAYVVIEYTKQ